MARLVESSNAVPIGTVKDYAGSTAPEGFLLCYGQALSTVANPEYAGLYAVIGISFGGTSNTNFFVPDLRGRVAAGKDNMGGVAASRVTSGNSGITGTTLGAAGGLETPVQHSHTVNSHSHGGGDHQHNVNTISTPGTVVAYDNRFGTVNLSGTGGTSHTSPSGSGIVNSGTVVAPEAPGTSTFGTGLSHGNIQPTMILNKIIKF